MQNLASKLQKTAVVMIFTLLCAKFPAFANHDKSVSLYGGLLGAGTAVFAILVAGLFTKLIQNFESKESASRLFAPRAAIVSLSITMVCFTAYLYSEFEWLLIIVRLSTVVGVIAVFAGMVMAWTTEGN